jgi:hypothetical protein
MVLYMIKPFVILKTTTEVDGTITIFFNVKKTVIEEYEGEVRPITYSLETAVNAPADTQDIDKFLYEHLTETGWIDA